MTSSVASRPGFLRWLVTAGDPATLVATFSTAAGSPVNLSGSTVAAACANWSTSHAGSATVGGASNNEVTVAFTDTITGQLTGGGWTWTLTVDGVTTLAGPLDVAQPGVAGVTGGDASAVVVVDDVNVAVTVTTTGTPGASALNDLTDVDTATDPPAPDDVLAWDGVTWTPATLTALGAPGLSNATPADLGTAAAGVSTEASRADHVHDMPTAAQVGALPDNTALLALGETSTTAYRGDRGKTAYDHSQTSGNPHGTSKADVGLGNVDNTSDANKPVSTAQQTALDGKAAASHSHAGTDITSGTVGTARLGSGSASSSTFLRGDQTWATPSGIADPGGSNDDFLQRKSGAWTNRTVAQVKADLGVQHVLSAPVGLWTGPVSGNTGECSQTDLFLGASGRGSASLVRLAAGTYDRVAVSVQSVGAATIRLGLWAADPTTGMPGDLVLDAGTISVAGSAGLREITINQTLSGWYWCSVSCDAYTSAFTMWGIVDTASSPIFGMPVATSDIRLKARNALTSESFGSGGLPSTFPTQGEPQASGPKLIFRRSA